MGQNYQIKTVLAWVLLGFVSKSFAATPASVNGASIIPGNKQSVSQIIDTKLNKWTLTSGVVYQNSKTAGFTGGVTDLFSYNNVVYQMNSAPAFWSWNGTTWVSVSSDPRVPNANGTVLLSSSPYMLVDSEKNLWSIADGVVYENGMAAGSSAEVVELIYANNTIYQENSAGGYWSWSGTTWSSCSNPLGGLTAPAQAAALGFTKLALNQGGSAGWSIDTANSGDPGFVWYLREGFLGKPTPSSLYSVSNGVLTITGNSSANWQLATAESSTNANGYVGTAFGGGFYTEASLEVGAACGSDATGFWGEPIEHFYFDGAHYQGKADSDQWAGQIAGFEQWVELDFMESYGQNFTFGILSWFGKWATTTGTCTSGNGFCNAGNNNGEDGIPWNNQEIAGIYGTSNGTVPAGTNISKANTYGALVVPSNLNKGTGYAQGYFNNTKSTKNPNTWSAFNSSLAPKPSGENSFSAVDKQNYMLILGATDAACTLKVNWVRVWQK